MHLRSIGRIAVLLACIMCMTDRAHSQGSKVALLIGVERYEKRGFSNLNYAEDDMTELA